MEKTQRSGSREVAARFVHYCCRDEMKVACRWLRLLRPLSSSCPVFVRTLKGTPTEIRIFVDVSWMAGKDETVRGALVTESIAGLLAYVSMSCNRTSPHNKHRMDVMHERHLR